MTESLVVEGLLVAAPSGRIRILVEGCALDFDVDEVLQIDEQTLSEPLVEGKAVAARVTLRPQARLLQIASSRGYQRKIWKTREPFTLSSREPVDFAYPEEYRRAEEEFFRARLGKSS